MIDKNEIANWIDRARPSATSVSSQDLVATLDLTTLGDLDTAADVTRLCERARSANVAAVCIYPRFIGVAKRALGDTPVKIATVGVDFPHGQAPLVVEEEGVRGSVAAGADEVDIVVRRGDILAGDFGRLTCQIDDLVEAVKPGLLKVILETGQIRDLSTIYEAARHVLDAGAHFLKTSTGKAGTGATPESVATLCLAIRDHELETSIQAGVKASGGVRTYEDASLYASLACEIAGIAYGDAKRFRIGASSLLDSLQPE